MVLHSPCDVKRIRIVVCDNTAISIAGIAINSISKIKVAILACCAAFMMTNALSPILAEVAAAFPSQPASTVQMIVVLPGLISLPFSLLANRLAALIPRKTIVLAALLVTLLGGLIPLVAHASMVPLLIASAVMGVGSGFLVPTVTALISDDFEGHDRSVMMGLQSTFVNGGGMVLAVLGGLLANVFWPYAYLVFLLLVPVAAIAAMLLPQATPVIPTDDKGLSVNRMLVYISIIGFCFSLLNTTYGTNVAMYLDATGLGDASSAGIATSMMAAVGIVAGLLFGRTFRILHTFALPVAISLMAAGMFLTYAGNSLLLVIAGGVLCGLGVSTFMPAGMVLVTYGIPPHSTALAIAIFIAANSVGMFASPFVINGLASLTGDGSVHSRYLVAGIGLLALFAVTLGKELQAKRA